VTCRRSAAIWWRKTRISISLLRPATGDHHEQVEDLPHR
jgi:hypothetical protein